MDSGSGRSGAGKRPGGNGETSGGTTVLGNPRSDTLVILLGLSLLGVVLGVLLPIVARWATDLSVLPLRTVFEFVASAEKPWQIAAFMAAGLVLGLVIAFVALSESLKVTLTDDRIEIEQNDRKETVSRADVSAVFTDNKHLVVLGRDSRQLVRGKHQAPAEKLAAAFAAHGYPWLERDPYADLFRAWVPGGNELRSEVHAVLTARKEALKRKSDKDVKDLTHALENLGYTVRDEGSDQFWRPLVRS